MDVYRDIHWNYAYNTQRTMLNQYIATQKAARIIIVDMAILMKT